MKPDRGTCSSPGLAFALLRSIREIEAGEWNRLAGENAFAAHGWLMTVEACHRADLEPLYFTLRREGVLIAGAVCYAARRANAEVGSGESLDHMIFGRASPVGAVLGISFLPALVCGPLLGYGWHLGLEPSLSPAEADAAVHLLLDAMESEAEAQGLQLAFAHVMEMEAHLTERLRHRGYLRSRNVPVGVLDLPWDSLDAYLGSFPSHRRRQLRREMRRNREAGNEVSLIDVPGELEERLQQLVDENCQKYNGVRFALGNGLLGELKRQFGEQAQVFTIRKSETVMAMCLVLLQGRTGFAVVVGVDAAAPATEYHYFQALFYSPIAQNTAGLDRLYFGRGIYDAKVSRGCWLAETWTYCRGNGLRRPAVAAWFWLASLWNEWKLPAATQAAIRRGR